MLANSAGAEAPHRFLKSLYAFVRDHLAVVNGLVLASGSACAVVEALAPRLPLLALTIRAATALLVIFIVALAIAPQFAREAPPRPNPESAAVTGAAPPQLTGAGDSRQLLLWEEASELAS